MLIELGNPKPQHAPNGEVEPLPGPLVTTMYVDDRQNEDGSYLAGYIEDTNAIDVLREFALRKGAVMHFGGNESLHQIINDWDLHATEVPSWISIDPQNRDLDNAEDLERFLSEYWGCKRGKPDDLEGTHYTEHLGEVYAPGQSPEE